MARNAEPCVAGQPVSTAETDPPGRGARDEHGRLRLIDLIDDMCAGRDVLFRWVRVAADVMTTRVKTLTLDDTAKDCLAFFQSNDVRHVCVMDVPTEEEGEQAKPYFVGIVSERDVFRRISRYVGKVGEHDTDEKALQQPLVQLVTRYPTSVSPETEMPDLLASMIDHRVDMLPVLDDGELVGLVTATDTARLFVRLGAIQRFCEQGGKKRRLSDLQLGALLPSVARTVEDIMTEDVVCLKPDECVSDAIQAMQMGKFRHVLVVDSQRSLMGIVSDRDVLQHLSFPERPSQADSGGFRDRLFETSPGDPALTLPVTQIMTREIVHVLPSCSVYDAAKRLCDMRASCLPVVDQQGKLRGILTVTDLMAALHAVYKLARGLRD